MGDAKGEFARVNTFDGLSNFVRSRLKSNPFLHRPASFFVKVGMTTALRDLAGFRLAIFPD